MTHDQQGAKDERWEVEHYRDTSMLGRWRIVCSLPKGGRRLVAEELNQADARAIVDAHNAEQVETMAALLPSQPASTLEEALKALDLLYDGKPNGFRRQLETEDFGDVYDHALPEFRAAYAKAADALDAAQGKGTRS